MPQLSPEAKYLLARVWFAFGTSPVRLKVKQLEALFGISRKTFLNARDELLADPRSKREKPYLVRCYRDDWDDERFGEFTRGRPVREFRLERAFGAELASAPAGGRVVSQANKAVAALQCRTIQLRQSTEPGNERVAAEAEELSPPRLAVPGKLLLAILWSVADRRGVVHDAGLRRLSRLAGMSLSRVRNHLNRLEQLGFFTLRVSGLTGRFLPGKVPGALVLNGAAIGYSRTVSKSRILDLGELESIAFVHSKSDQALRKRKVAAGGKAKGGDSDQWIEAEAAAYPWQPPNQKNQRDEKERKEKPPPLYTVFAGEPRRAEIREYLLFKACAYVTWLVNEHPTQLLAWGADKEDEPEAARLLLATVQEELLSNGSLIAKFESGRALLVRWFCLHVWRRAREVISAIAVAEKDEGFESVIGSIGSRYSDIIVLPMRGYTLQLLTYELKGDVAKVEAESQP
ncbi:hypothetical protein [Alloalcanivorax marinus]|uniref:hypothetical protein n=1 Tax=Alloalcanivorax marinus TaxID=1177169 RepID=UPI00195CB7E3|nr:hypothetical protein [Alloalcanivorax marinus]MBM7333527.1 hypothetical protein [Alloalcanivorax marinus]